MNLEYIISVIDQRIANYNTLAEARREDDPEISTFYRGGANSLKILASWLERTQLTE